MASVPSTASRNAANRSGASTTQDSQPAVDVTAITSRDDFLLELGEALDGQAAVRPVETLEAALEAMAAGKRGQVLVIDARALPEVRAAVDAAQEKLPRAVVLVFAEGAAEKELGSALKGSKVFAVLSTSIEPRKTAAVFEGAISEATAAKSNVLSARAELAAEVESSIGALRARLATPERTDSGRRKPARALLIGLGAALTALALGATWYFSRGGSSTPAAPASSAAPAPRQQAPAAPASEVSPLPAAPASNFLVEGKVDELLEKARLAMHERRYTDPAGDNALLYYRSAAAADGNNGEAADGLQRVAGVLASRFEEALNGGRLDEATLTLANFRAAAAGDARVAGLEQRLYAAQMAKALADGSLDRAAVVARQAQQSGNVPADQIARWRGEIARHQEDTKVQKLATLAEERLRDGRLNEGDDGASAYVQQLQSAAPNNPATARVTHELIGAYLKKARDAALAKNNADEEHWLSEARGLGLKATDVAAFQRELVGARAKAAAAESDRTLQLARTALREGRLTDPAQDSGAYYLTQLQNADPTNAGLLDASRELAGKLLERARAAVLAGKAADPDLAAAKRWGADPKDLQAVQQLSAAPKSKGIDPATLAASLRKVRSPAPDYPPQALAQKIAGYVTLEYSVDASGTPRDVHVVEATPPGVFDQAAVNAVKRWRYAPVQVNGAAVEVPVKTRMRFELPK